MVTTKVLSYLGLATKAGKVVSGEFSTEKAVKERKAYLVIVAMDASDNTNKMFTNMCTHYKVPIISWRISLHFVMQSVSNFVHR